MAEGWEKVTDPSELALAKLRMAKGGKKAEAELTPAFSAKMILQGLPTLERVGKGLLDRSDPRSALGEYAGSLSGLGQSGRFDSLAIGLLPFAKKLSRAKGEGSQSDTEAKDYKSLLPNMGKTDAINKDRIASLRQLAISVLQELGEDVPDEARPTDSSLDDLIAEYQRRRTR